MLYEDFLKTKAIKPMSAGLSEAPKLHPSLKPHQRSGVEFAVKLGRAALFHDTGLGKTRIQLEWARIMSDAAQAPALILAPLAVAHQTVKEGEKIGVNVTRCYEQSDVRPGVNITNYDRLHLFDTSQFGAVVLDESSILKSFTGATKRALCEQFSATPYRLCCTATPAPNDHMEIGNHSDFLGIMPAPEMLSRWFIVDTMDLGKYRLKGHAVSDFWDWVASWAQCVSSPEDLGFDGSEYELPELIIKKHIIDTDISENASGMLFRMPVMSATQLHKEKKATVEDRAAAVARLVSSEPDEPWLIWCDTDYEANALNKVVPDAIEVRGSMKSSLKESRLDDFSDGRARVMITKPKVAGFGLNWQHCARIAFIGVSYSYESYYQAIRRCWRFGQSRPVHVHVVMAATESPIWDTVVRKADAHDDMKEQMLAATRRAHAKSSELKVSYRPTFEMEWAEWLFEA